MTTGLIKYDCIKYYSQCVDGHKYEIWDANFGKVPFVSVYMSDWIPIADYLIIEFIHLNGDG